MASNSVALTGSVPNPVFQEVADEISVVLGLFAKQLGHVDEDVLLKVNKLTTYIVGQVGYVTGTASGLAMALDTSKASAERAWTVVDHLEVDKEHLQDDKRRLEDDKRRMENDKEHLREQIKALTEQNKTLTSTLVRNHEKSAEGAAVEKLLDANKQLVRENACLRGRLQDAEHNIVQLQTQLSKQTRGHAAEAHYTPGSVPQDMRSYVNCT